MNFNCESNLEAKILGLQNKLEAATQAEQTKALKAKLTVADQTTKQLELRINRLLEFVYWTPGWPRLWYCLRNGAREIDGEIDQ